MRQGLPYVVVGGVGFYERKEVKDLLAYLRLVLNPRDPIALRRVAQRARRAASGPRRWRSCERAGRRSARLSLVGGPGRGARTRRLLPARATLPLRPLPRADPSACAARPQGLAVKDLARARSWR